MKLARLHAIGDIRIEEVPLPVPAAGEELVQVTAVGLCGTDIHWYKEGSVGTASLTQPVVLGHEFAGILTGGPHKGQRVAVDPSMSCGHCEFCEEGNPNLCRHIRFAGDGVVDGSLREFVAWPEPCLFALPDSVSDDEGVLLEPLGIAIFAVDLAHLKTGMTVGVLGCGPVGLLTLQVARAAGASRLIATDILPQRLEIARALGAEVYRADDPDVEAQIWKATHQTGVDVAIECAGVNDAVENAMGIARSGSRVVLVGIPGDDRISFKASTARRKGLSIMMQRRSKPVYPRAIRLVQSGQVDIRSLATHHFPLAQIDSAFQLAGRREGIKVIVTP